jgi:nucleoside-diphosphate-sugar epimerase
MPFDLARVEVLPAFEGIQVVVHAAARVHVMREEAVDALAEFRDINVQGTLKLARQAAESGVKRFIFISSIKVNGECTPTGKAFKADDLPSPMDPYGISKYEAEEALKHLGRETGMEVVIIRPPLVYGPGVKGNFMSLLGWLRRGIPLPLGAVRNRRSLVSIENLISLIVTCIDHPAAANQVFLVSDGEDLSTSQLLNRLSRAFGRRARLLPVPEWLLKLVASMFGMQAVAQRLCGSLQVNIDKNRELLGWLPPVSVDRAMRQTVNHYLDINTQ